jgi:hypothetical protein
MTFVAAGHHVINGYLFETARALHRGGLTLLSQLVLLDELHRVELVTECL